MEFGSKLGIPAAVMQPTMDTRTGKQITAAKTAEEFESFLLFTILKEFDRTTQFTKKSSVQETQMSIVYEKIAGFLAKKGIGIKQVLERYADRGAAKVFKGNGEKM
jgi:Rod binding domain-containing protein